MPWAGYPRPIAPRLTALHERAVDYPHAYAISSFTSKSLGGLVSGRYPSELARTGVFFTQYLKSNAMVCESLAEAGVPCVAGMAHGYLAKGYAGFDQGFRDWRLVPGITFDYNTDPYVTSDKLVPMAISMLSDESLVGQKCAGTDCSGAASPPPFFAWFHFMDPHDKYQSHEGPHWGSRARDLYDEEVLYTDRWVGALLDFVDSQPWSKKTVLIVSADHGEAFGEHHEFRHGHELYEELVHVLLFVVVPGRPARTIEATRSHIDLVPTIVELLGQTPGPCRFEARRLRASSSAAKPPLHATWSAISRATTGTIAAARSSTKVGSSSPSATTRASSSTTSRPIRASRWICSGSAAKSRQTCSAATAKRPERS